MAKQAKKRRKVKQAHKRTPRTKKPKHMSLDEWQVALRREYGREQNFTYKNLGDEPVFSEFSVTNPESGGVYRVAIRGQELGANYCSCPDFAVNTLGTCKHIEWLLAKLARKRGGKRAFRVGYHPPYSEVYLQYGVQRRVRFRPGTDCPDTLQKEAVRYFDEDGYLREEAAATFERFARRTAKSRHEVRIYDDALEFIARIRDGQTRRHIIEKKFGNGRAAKTIQGIVKVNLYPYQLRGALFAAKAGRCLIADDMGLGKTVQSIAACEILARTVRAERVLVVCPTALKHQWRQEIERFVDRSATVIEGLQHTRKALYAEESFFKITNYETIHRDLDLINGWRPDMVILDEAQRIKNWQARRAKAVKQINSEYAIVLTGTPLENRLEELHSIMEFVDRFRLGPLFRFLNEHQYTEETGRVVGYKDLDQIKEILAPVLIRRRKQEVLSELPERTDKHYFVDMTEPQRKVHEENQDIVARIVAKWRRYGFLSEADQRRLLIALQNMRMVCNSTFLIDKETDHSTKLDECCILLDDILANPANKVVIFSQWLGTHELLIRRFNGEARRHVYYHGGLDGQSRKEVIERFKKDPECRILLSTDSGGVGLNLQHASVVINMDQPWNPAVLEQRIGRVHRLGQHRNVQVCHFVSQGGIEQGMLEVLKFKSGMFEGVLDGGQSEVFLGGSKMNKFMETVESVSQATPDCAPPQDEERKAEGEETTAPHIDEAAPAETPSPRGEAWNELLDAGLDFLGKLGAAMQTPSDKRPGIKPEDLVARNEKTGARELRVPLPDDETAEKIGELLSHFGNVLKTFGERRK